MKETNDKTRNENPRPDIAISAPAPERELPDETWDWFLRHQMEIRRAILQKLSKRLRKESRSCQT